MLECSEVSSGYNGVAAVRGATLKVHAHEIVALVGSNGAGKSTLLKTLAGLVATTSGTIALDGAAIASLPVHQRVRRGLRLVPEGRRLFPELSVKENLLSGSHHGTAERAVFERVLALFPVLGSRQQQRAATLSGGEQQMLTIGRALMGSPKVLLLDEPSLGLAPRLVREVFDAIAELADSGIAVLVAEQNLRAALRVASRGYVMRTGEVVFRGTSEELASRQDLPELYWGKMSVGPS